MAVRNHLISLSPESHPELCTCLSGGIQLILSQWNLFDEFVSRIIITLLFQRWWWIDRSFAMVRNSVYLSCQETRDDIFLSFHTPLRVVAQLSSGDSYWIGTSRRVCWKRKIRLPTYINPDIYSLSRSLSHSHGRLWVTSATAKMQFRTFAQISYR